MYFLVPTFLLVLLLCPIIPPSFSQSLPNVKRLNPTEWITDREPSTKLNLISWIIDGCFYYKSEEDRAQCQAGIDEHEEPKEYQSFDGFYNNIFKVDLGAVDTPLLRRVPPVYEDGAYEPVKGNRINPFEASRKLMTRRASCSDSNFPSAETAACGSKTGKTAFLVYFGQQVVEEILDAQRPGCPPEYFNIPIPEDHEFRSLHTQMPFLRSRYAQNTGHAPSNPRQQLNEITPWIDGGLIYGTSKGWADVLRTFPNGTLHPHGQLASDNDEGLFPARNTLRLPLANPPPPAWHTNWTEAGETAKVNRFYVLGNPRGNENAFLLSFGVVLFRWHNQIAAYLHESRPTWNGERIFQEARKWAIATYQHLVVYDWLEEWLAEPLEPYKGYDPSVDPQIEQFFQTAAMRFGHTLVTPGAYLRDYACAKCKQIKFSGLGDGLRDAQPGIGAVRTCNIFWRPQEPLTMELESNDSDDGDDDGTTSCPGLNNNHHITDIDRLLMGMSSQRAEREDNMIVEDLRGRVFGPLEFSRRDLMAINIQRGRDHGTPDYNTAREAFGLKRITSVEEYKSLTSTATPDEILRTMVEIHKYNNDENSTMETEDEEMAWTNIDVWTGGILETSDRPGPLFRAIIKDQFTRIRNADRFWFENRNGAVPRFSEDELARIKTLKVVDIILSVTRMKPEDIQENPFQIPDDGSNKLTGCNPTADPTLWHTNRCVKTKYYANGTVDNIKVFDGYHFPQLDSSVNPVENCTAPGTYDYFSGSQVPFILTFLFLGAAIIGIAVVLKLITNSFRMKNEPPVMTTTTAFGGNQNERNYQAREWSCKNTATKPIDLTVTDDFVIVVRDVIQGKLLREIHINRMEDGVKIIIVTDQKHLVLKNLNGYDLVLEFEGPIPRQRFIARIQSTLTPEQIAENTQFFSLRETLANHVVTKTDRMIELEGFFRVIFKIHTELGKPGILESEEVRKVFNMELTQAEFADCLGMASNSTFIDHMFRLVDKDQNGYVSFIEFLTMLTILRTDEAKDKAQFLFHMYDVRRQGFLTIAEFKLMITSLIEAANERLGDAELENLVKAVIASAQLKPGEDVQFEAFMNLFMSHGNVLGNADIPLRNEDRPPAQRRRSYIHWARNEVERIYDTPDAGNDDLDTKNKLLAVKTKNEPFRIIVWIQLNRLELFWVTMYTLVVIAIFAERAYYYSVEREHGGLRHIAGYGVTVTRGAASVMMFCFSTLLLTMCRNLITNLRETFLRHYIPFDAYVAFHKYIAYVGLIASIIHVIGHGINFYHISTQTPEDVTCLFRDYFRPTHVLPSFTYWTFGTVTGLAGIILTIHGGIIYIFATSYARSQAFRAFWMTHSSYPLWYLLIIIHGSGRLVQDPLFFNFLVGPLVIFVVDKMLTISRNSVAIPVIEAEHLPSNVTKLKFSRPAGFGFRSGQWIRIACAGLNPSEFHPFTIASSPDQPTLTVFIRAVGPFTSNIRRIYEREKPKLFIEGPFGEGHQDWHRYDVSILIGGGIGVTPFASILKDVVTTSSSLRQCKKVHFLWVTRTQKQFEWMVDIIREVETHDMISADVCITQFYDKYDLRTTLLYICEESFQKINNRSIFTGLRSKTHFGRPDFDLFFRSIKHEHPQVQKFGVFSCGALPMLKAVDEACIEINNSNSGSGRTANSVIFEHHYENY